MMPGIMTQTRPALYKAALRAGLIAACLAATGCVYRIAIQQGNLLEPDAVDQVQVGMSRSAVEFLLGTPMVSDPFHENRWDYPFYLKVGRSRDVQRSWLVIYFEDGRVSRIDRDVALEPSS